VTAYQENVSVLQALLVIDVRESVMRVDMVWIVSTHVTVRMEETVIILAENVSVSAHGSVQHAPYLKDFDLEFWVQNQVTLTAEETEGSGEYSLTEETFLRK